MINTPILLIIFNRPDTTRQVIRALERVQPTKLFVASDRPRADKADDLEKILQARELRYLASFDMQL